MLTLEQCKNLAKWGLPQGLYVGNWYWGKEDCVDEWFMALVTDDSPVELDFDYVKAPTLDELMEFARGLDSSWHLAPDPKSKTWWVEWDPSGPIAENMRHPWHGFEAETPILSLYDFCECYFEKVKQ